MNPNTNLTYPATTTMVATEVRSPYNRVVAIFLAVVTGAWGLHRFYVGKYITGLLYFFTAGLFGFGWMFDILMIALGRFKDADGRVLGPPAYRPRPELVGQRAPQPPVIVPPKKEEDFYLEEAMRDPLEEKFDVLEKEMQGTDGNIW